MVSEDEAPGIVGEEGFAEEECLDACVAVKCERDERDALDEECVLLAADPSPGLHLFDASNERVVATGDFHGSCLVGVHVAVVRGCGEVMIGWCG